MGLGERDAAADWLGRCNDLIRAHDLPAPFAQELAGML